MGFLCPLNRHHFGACVILTPVDWQTKYGSSALIAGASVGLGAAYAEALAARGMNLVLIARRVEPLEECAHRLQERYGITVDCVPLDLADAGLEDTLFDIVHRHDIGIGVYNAAYAPVGSFLERDLSDLEQVIDLNVRGPLIFSRVVGGELAIRGRGGLVLMSSLAGFQGTPRLATYAATKAFNTILAEGLWYEFADKGIDVVVSCAGAIRTPGYTDIAMKEAPGTMAAQDVAEHTLRKLGRGPRVVPGLINRLASALMGHWMPRSAAVRIMAKNTRELS